MFPHKNFGSKELERFLRQHGCIKKAFKASSHVNVPIRGNNLQCGELPFVTLQLGRGQYDRDTQDKILGDLRRKGFSENDLKSFFS